MKADPVQASNDALLESGQEGHQGQELPTTSQQPPGEGPQPNIQRVPIRQPWFEVAKGEDEAWYWCLWGGHGRAMAMSSVGYRLKEDCIEAIRQVGTYAADQSIQIAVAYSPKQRAK